MWRLLAVIWQAPPLSIACGTQSGGTGGSGVQVTSGGHWWRSRWRSRAGWRSRWRSRAGWRSRWRSRVEVTMEVTMEVTGLVEVTMEVTGRVEVTSRGHEKRSQEEVTDEGHVNIAPSPYSMGRGQGRRRRYATADAGRRWRRRWWWWWWFCLATDADRPISPSGDPFWPLQPDTCAPFFLTGGCRTQCRKMTLHWLTRSLLDVANSRIAQVPNKAEQN